MIYLSRADRSYIARPVHVTHQDVAEVTTAVNDYLTFGTSPGAAIAIAESNHRGGLMRILCAWCCLFVLMPAPICFGQDRFGDITVEAEGSGLKGPDAGHGYRSLRFHVVNTGTETHTVTLDLGTEVDWHYLNRVTGGLRVAPGGRGEVYLPVFSTGALDNRVTVTVDDKVFEPVSTPRLWPGLVNYNSIQVLSSVGLDATFVEYDEVNKAYFDVDEHPCRDWPATWLDYAGYHVILLTARDWDTLDPDVRLALATWRRNGGNLVFDALPSLDPPDSARTVMLEGVPFYFEGFGATAVRGKPFSDLTRAELMGFTLGAKRVFYAVTESRNEAVNTRRFPVVQDQNVSFRTFFGVMLALVFVLGPLNLWFMTRCSQRILFLVTLPILSLAASVVIFCIALFSDGLHTRLRRASVTLLDQRLKLATTLAHQGVYAPLTLSDGMHFGADTEVMPVGTDNRYRAVDFREDQHLTEGWVRARITAHFLQRQTETRRERVVFEPTSDGGPTALNGLGVDIERLRFVDADGRAWTTENLAAGAQTALTDAGYSCEPEPADALNKRLGAFWEPGAWFRGVLDPTARQQNPYTYLAEVKSSPFIGPLPERVTTWQETSMIYGLVEAP